MSWTQPVRCQRITKPERKITVEFSLESSEIYTQSTTGLAWNNRSITYTADFLVQPSPDCPAVPSGFYSFLVDRRVQLRKDETFSQDHARFSISFPSGPTENENATVPKTFDVTAIFEKNAVINKCTGTGYLGSSGGSCGPISFVPRDGDLDTLMSPWTAVHIILTFPFPIEKVTETKTPTVDSLRQMLNSAADCVVTASDGKQFHAHRSVLAAQSPVFAAMFEHDTAEKQDATVKITDICGSVMEEFLVFLYNHSVNVEQIKDLVEDLYHAADKYDVPDLRMICEDLMCTTMDAKNAVQRLTFAHDRGMNKLRTKAINFISENKTSV